MMHRRPSNSRVQRSWHFPLAPLFTRLLGAALFLFAPAAGAPAQSTPPATSGVTVVLPPKVVAGQQATLAVLDADGKLAPGVTVELENNPSVRTDRTGRGFFQVSSPGSGGVLLATVSSDSAAAIEDSAPPADAGQTLAIAPAVSVRDYFSICGSGFSGNADENRVNINGAPALVLAASPECLVVLPGADAAPGPATISVEAAGQKRTAATSLVSLAFESPNPALLPDQRGRLIVRVLGSELPLRIVVGNKTPDVLRFLRGDEQELVTRGGPQNLAVVEVQAIRSGDFSLRTRIEPQPDAEAARRYLQAAAPLAPQNLSRELHKLSGKLAHHPHDFRPLRRKLDEILAATPPGDFQTLLRAARAAL
jgi:hypothetical protein